MGKFCQVALIPLYGSWSESLCPAVMEKSLDSCLRLHDTTSTAYSGSVNGAAEEGETLALSLTIFNHAGGEL